MAREDDNEEAPDMQDVIDDVVPVVGTLRHGLHSEALSDHPQDSTIPRVRGSRYGNRPQVAWYVGDNGAASIAPRGSYVIAVETAEGEFVPGNTVVICQRTLDDGSITTTESLLAYTHLEGESTSHTFYREQIVQADPDVQKVRDAAAARMIEARRSVGMRAPKALSPEEARKRDEVPFVPRYIVVGVYRRFK